MTNSNSLSAELPMSELVAEYHNVSKIYTLQDGSLSALHQLSLQVKRGEMLVIMGPSGCGKSTALEMLAGHCLPTSGVVKFLHNRVLGPDPKRTIVFQQDTLWPWRTVKENLLFGLESRTLQRLGWILRLASEVRLMLPLGRHRALNHMMDRAEVDEAMAWLSVVGLSDFVDAYPHQLSGGMRKRLELARAYAIKPELLLLDEPFGNLDAILREEMQQVLERLLLKSHCTGVFITHDSSEAVAIADRIAVLSPRPGRLLNIIPVNLPRPRNSAVRKSFDFFELVNRVREGLNVSMSGTIDLEARL